MGAGRFEEFLGTRRSPHTATNYRRCTLQVVKDPDAFLELATRDRAAAERLLIEHFTTRKVSGSYQRMKFAALKSFLQFYDAELGWKKLASVLPLGRKVAADRAPTREEVARLLSACDLRARVVVLCMASGGFRVGTWEWLDVGDVDFLDGGVARLRVYRGEPEEYFTFVTPEAAEAVRAYLDSRRRAGEEIGPGSPLVRDKWDSQYSRCGGKGARGGA